MLELDSQVFLDLCEETGKLAFFDIESNGLKADYGGILVASVKPFGEKPITFRVKTVGNDRTLVGELRDCLESFTLWCGYFSKGFDIPFIRSRLLRHNMADIEKQLHIDMYFALKANMLTARRSQGHLISWLGTPVAKMSVSADAWAEVAANPKKHLPTLVKRCESDCAGLEGLYVRTRHLIKTISR